MALVKPFRGFRPRREFAQKVSAPPYDVVSEEEAREIVQSNPFSFLRISRPEVDFEPGINPYSYAVYKKGRENFEKFIKDGIFEQDAKDCFYIYRIEVQGRVQTGLMAGFSIEEYDEDLIKKHEHTRPEKVEDRVKHTLLLGANAGPVLLAFRAEEKTNDLLERISIRKQDFNVVAPDGSKHSITVVENDNEIIEIIDAFRKIPSLYIADGHHRAKAASEVFRIKKKDNPNIEESYKYFLAVAFPHSQLRIMDYNRIVKRPEGMTNEEILRKISEKFEISPSDEMKPVKKRTYKMFSGLRWYLLEVKKGVCNEDDPIESLDVSILHSSIIHPIFGIEDPRRDSRIEFAGGVVSPKELERKCRKDGSIAFMLYPMSMEQLLKIADSGKVAPPKSTWFEPKLRSGLVVRPF